jgi:hypothetical protein
MGPVASVLTKGDHENLGVALAPIPTCESQINTWLECSTAGKISQDINQPIQDMWGCFQL